MLMEGTGKYFLWLFLIFLMVYITVKISLGFLLTRAKEKAWKGYVPVYTTYVFVELLGLNKKTFYFSLIPFVNFYYFYLIIKEMLKGYGQNPKEAIWFILIPMYKFPELAFKRPKFLNNEYDLTEEFLETQDILFNQHEGDSNNQVPEINNQNVQEPKNMVIEPTSYEQIPDLSSQSSDLRENASDSDLVKTEAPADSVFTNKNLEPDKTHTTYVEAKEEVKEEKPIITPVAKGRPKMCPKCGARLAPNATTCFLCGTKL